MIPRYKSAGTAGMLAGVALACEFGFFMISGWSPAVADDPAAALAWLRDSSYSIQAAGAFGFGGLALMAIFFAGLGGRLQEKSQTLGAATVLLGLVGVTGHSLVPLGFWVAVPAFQDLGGTDMHAARTVWSAFNMAMDGAQSVGTFFMGLAMVMAGTAMLSKRQLSGFSGWLGLVAGIAAITTLAGAVAPLSDIGRAAFLPSLALTVLFRIVVGHRLCREESRGE